MTRTFALSRIEFASSSFLMESFINPWGEDDPILAQIHSGEFDEGESIAFWAYAVSLAGRNAVVLDVGAFTGLFSLLATALAPNVKAIAFEPATVSYGRLAQNVIWNGMDVRILAANLAASDTPQLLTLRHAFGIYSRSPGESVNASVEADHTQAVAAVDLDMLLGTRDQLPHYLNSAAFSVGPIEEIAAIKIDVEGYEAPVLRGGLKLLRRYRPPLICEAWNTDAESAISRILEPEGYVVKRNEGERNLVALPEERLGPLRAAYVAWKQSHAPSLELRASRVFTFAL